VWETVWEPGKFGDAQRCVTRREPGKDKSERPQVSILHTPEQRVELIVNYENRSLWFE